MHLAFFINSLSKGGAENVVAQLLPYFCSKYKVSLILLEEVLEFPIPKDVQIFYIGNIRSAKGISRVLQLPRQSRLFTQLCKEEKITHCLSFMSRPNFIACLSKKNGLKIWLAINERTFLSTYLSQLGFPAGNVSKYLTKKLYPMADLILCNAAASLADLKKMLHDPSVPMAYLHNPIQLGKFSEVHFRESVIQTHTTTFNFIHVGRFRPEKNHKLLIQAFSKLATNNAMLFLAGEDAFSQELKEEIASLHLEERVVLLGKLDNPYAEMKAADCLLLSSKFEGFPNVILESLALSTPVISKDFHSGPREILMPKSDPNITLQSSMEISEVGILVPTMHASLLAEAMQWAMNHPDELAMMSAKSASYVQHLDLPIVAKKLEEFMLSSNLTKVN